MARKPILEGGKRDEIIEVAKKLFLENGYDGTSVRMVLDEVGGEVGMFYHYFSSKTELFEKVVEKFIKDQGDQLSLLMSSNLSTIPLKEKLEQLIDFYYFSMGKFEKLANGKLHWSVISTFHTITLESMLPHFKILITHILTISKSNEGVNIDLITPFAFRGISGLLKSDSFLALTKEQQRNTVIELLCRVLQIPVDIFN